MLQLFYACLRRPLVVLLIAAAFTLALAAGALRVGVDTGYRALLGADHPMVRELETVAARFGGGVPFAIVFRCEAPAPCRSVFDASALAMAHDVAVALAALPGVRHVEGPATSPLLAPELFDLPRARQLAPDGKPAAGPARARPTRAARSRLGGPDHLGRRARRRRARAAHRYVRRHGRARRGRGARAARALRGAGLPVRARGRAGGVRGRGARARSAGAASGARHRRAGRRDPAARLPLRRAGAARARDRGPRAALGDRPPGLARLAAHELLPGAAHRSC